MLSPMKKKQASEIFLSTKKKKKQNKKFRTFEDVS